MKKILSIISIFFLLSTQISIAEPTKNADWCAKGVKSADYLACKAGPADTNPTTGMAVGAVVLGAIAVGIIDHEDDDDVTCEQTASGLVCSSDSSCNIDPSPGTGCSSCTGICAECTDSSSASCPYASFACIKCSDGGLPNGWAEWD